VFIISLSGALPYITDFQPFPSREAAIFRGVRAFRSLNDEKSTRELQNDDEIRDEEEPTAAGRSRK